MPVDLPNLLLGLLAAAIPLAGLAWQLQRRASLAEREIALLGERLATAQLAQDGLNAQLETSRRLTSNSASAMPGLPARSPRCVGKPS